MKTKTNRRLRKILSIALCLALVMSYVPFASVMAGAAEAYDVYIGDVPMDNLLISRGALAAVTGISAISKNTDNPDTAAMLNKWAFGMFDQASLALSQQITALHRDVMAELDFIEQKLDRKLSDIEKTLGSDAADNAYDNYLSAWNTDVTDPLADNGYHQVVNAYKNYLEYAGSYMTGSIIIYNGQEAIATQEMVESCCDSFRAALEAFSGCDYDTSAGFEDSTSYYDHILYETDAVDQKAVSTINALIGRMINAHEAPTGDRYLDRAAQVAYAYFPYSEDQAAFVDAAIMKQSNEMLIALLAYQEFIGMRIEYGEAKYEALKASGASKTELEELRNELDKCYAPNKNIKDLIYGGRACDHVGGVTAALNTWLSEPIYISNSDNSYLYLEDYIRATDTDTITLTNTNFAEQSNFDTILAESEAGKNAAVIDEMVNTALIERDKVEKQAVSSADTITKQVEFVRRGVVVVNPNGEATVKPVYLLADTTEDKSGRLLQDLDWEKTAQEATDLEGYWFAVPHADYYNLRDGVYSDGYNELTMVSADELQALVDNNPLSSHGGILRNYFADVLGEYPEGRNLVMITSEGTASGNAENMYYTEYKGIDMLNTTSFVTENVTHDALDSTSYTVMLAGENVTYGNLTVESDSLMVSLSGDGYDAQTGKTAAASAVTLTVTPAGCNKISRITAQYHEDPTNPYKVTYTDVLVDENTADSLSYNDDGSVELVYYMPYTNVTLFVESQSGHPFSDAGFCPTCGAYEPAVRTKNGYLISNAGQLYWFSAAVRGDMTHISWDDLPTLENGQTMATLYGTITAPIDLSVADDAWVPIGTAEEPYRGYFDGGYQPITNLNGTLFGYTENVTLRNIAIESGTFGPTEQEQECIGSIVSRLDGNSSMTHCYSKAIYTGSATRVAGGLAGSVNDGIIQDCYFAGSLSSASDCDVGGLIGCYNAGTLRNSFAYSDSLVGYMDSGCSIENCYFLSDTEDSFDGTTAMTAAQFASGEVAYLLQGEQTEQVWGQSIDVDAFPMFATKSNKVYSALNCQNNTTYSNTQQEDGHHTGGEATCVSGKLCDICGVEYDTATDPENHEKDTYTNGFYDCCGAYQSAELNSDGYYEIGNAGQLYWFAQLVNIDGVTDANTILTENIDLEGRIWYPIGLYDDVAEEGGELIQSKYKGTFDGNFYTVSNFTAIGNGSQGLLGWCDYNSADVMNLGICNAVVSGWNAGAVAGYGANLSNCYAVDCTITGSSDSNTSAVTISSLGGNNAPSTIQNCYAYNCTLIVGTGEEYVMHPVGGVRTNGMGNVQNTYYGKITTQATFTSTQGAEEKSETQFKSGEVAYLLQQGNTEQVWGQDSNQAGAKPIFDSTGLYKVVTVGETGNYSVANVGDTNGDGTVDVEDYQALVNKALADDHEQIETASYDDIVKYDLDGDGYLDVIDAYLLHLFINGFTTVDVYAVGDYDLNGKAYEEADIKAIKHAIENPEKLSTAEKYACDINNDGKVSEEDLTELTAIYGEIYSIEHTFLGKKCKICGLNKLNIADISKTVYFNDNGNKLDLSTLFTLPNGAGNVTYELVSGSGNLDGSTLNIVLQGTEKIKVTVAETETNSADEFEITVTVEAPKGSGVFDGIGVTIGK